MSIFPIDPALAAKAYRWCKKGLKGKAISEKLGKGITTDDANLLASVGATLDRRQRHTLADAEIGLIVALAALEDDRLSKGEVSSPKAWMLCRATGLSEGQISRMTRKRLNAKHWDGSGLFDFVSHSRNGHIRLEPAGRAIAALYQSLRNPQPEGVE